MKDKIIKYANQLNIEYVGVAPVMEYNDLREKLIIKRERYSVSQFEEKDIEKRCDPRITYPWAKSIIVCLFPYYTGEDYDSNISRYARIPDYHIVVKNKLNQICDFIKKEQDSCTTESFADTGILHDRHLE